MKAVILCGGKGTRMRSVSQTIPKALIQIGGTPILEHQIRLLKQYGVNEIILTVQHMARAIIDFVQDGSKWGVKIKCVEETPPLGTAGGLGHLREILQEDFIVVYGDVMMNLDITKVVDFHLKNRAFATLVTHPNDHPRDSDLIEVNADNKIIGFHRKPHERNKDYHNLVNAGVYVLSRNIFDYIPDSAPSDFINDVFPKAIHGNPIFSYRTFEYMKDMGTPSRLAEVNSDYHSGLIARRSKKKKQKAIFLDRDGVINEAIDQLHKKKDIKLIEGSAEAVRNINRSEYLAVVVTNQPVIARGLCTLDDLDEIHKHLETLLGQKGAWLDGIYFCPHHPDSGYEGEDQELKIRCACRKPEIGMIQQAVKDFNLELKQSFLIGDSDRDIGAALKAGVKSIRINDQEDKRADYTCRNLEAAVNYIFDLEKKP